MWIESKDAKFMDYRPRGSLSPRSHNTGEIWKAFFFFLRLKRINYFVFRSYNAVEFWKGEGNKYLWIGVDGRPSRESNKAALSNISGVV